MREELFKKGDQKSYTFIVNDKDFAHFDTEEVHKVCSTFALAREIEWSTRLFVKEMKEEAEEGIGTLLEIKHISPAFEGETVEIIATFEEIINGEIICSFNAFVKDSNIAKGKTGQRILPLTKIKEIFSRHQ